jgi:hypothetical protein
VTRGRVLKQEVDMYEMDHRPKGERDAYKLLYAGFMAAPIIAGIDKFTDKLGNWDKYLSDEVAEKLPVQRHTFMQAVGLIEIAAGLLVAAKPKWGGYVVGAWLGASSPICGRSRSTETSPCVTLGSLWGRSRWHAWQPTRLRSDA